MSILNPKNNKERYEILPYQPHPVISRLKVNTKNRIDDVNKKLPENINQDEKEINDKSPNFTEAYSAALFSDIIERLDKYYEEKMTIEVDKLKIFCEKEMLSMFKGQQKKCCCVQQEDGKRAQEMQLAMVSLNQFNMNLQKKNDELTNQILTIIMHMKNQDHDKREERDRSRASSGYSTQRSRSTSAARKSTKKKSFMCCMM